MCSDCHVHHFEHPHLTGEKTWDLGVARLCFHTSATKALDRPLMAMTQHVYQTSGKKQASLRHATWIILINAYGFCWGEQKKTKITKTAAGTSLINLILFQRYPAITSCLPSGIFVALGLLLISIVPQQRLAGTDDGWCNQTNRNWSKQQQLQRHKIPSTGKRRNLKDKTK